MSTQFSSTHYLSTHYSSTQYGIGIEIPARHGGDSSGKIRRGDIPLAWYEQPGVTREQIQKRLEQEDEEILALIMAATRYLQ